MCETWDNEARIFFLREGDNTRTFYLLNDVEDEDRFIRIEYCPWCGVKLPDPQHE